MVHPDDGQVIKRSDLASVVEPGMILEMTIVLRQNLTFQIVNEKCPRCGHINAKSVINSSWIEWKVVLTFFAGQTINLINYSSQCAGQFSVSEDDLQDDVIHDERGGMDGVTRSELRPPGDDGLRYYRRISISINNTIKCVHFTFQ